MKVKENIRKSTPYSDFRFALSLSLLNKIGMTDHQNSWFLISKGEILRLQDFYHTARRPGEGCKL